jgi:hypothetical protein
VNDVTIVAMAGADVGLLNPIEGGGLKFIERILSANLKLQILAKLVGLNADNLLNRDEEEHIDSINVIIIITFKYILIREGCNCWSHSLESEEGA